MFSAAVRVLARAATIQLEEAAAAHPRAPTRTLLKGKERALPIRRDIRPEPAVVESDLGVHAGTEGFGGKEHQVERRTAGLEAGHGMEEHLASIVDEMPQVSESSAGPSRLPRLRPETVPQTPQAQKPSTPHSILETPKPQRRDKLEVNAAKSAPTPQLSTPHRPTPAPATVPIVEDSPLIQAELPVTDQLHEILDSKTDEPHSETKAAERPLPTPAKPVDEPVVSPSSAPKAKLSVDPLPPRTEEMESGDRLPTTNEAPLPVADDTEDVSPFTHFCLSTDSSGTCSDACFKGPIVKDWTFVPLWM
jgi:hypothetical protein